MEVVNRKEKRVKIIIGQHESGDSSVRKPIKSIILRKASVQEVYDLVIKALGDVDDSKS